jgi:hypothetical protein
MLTYAAGRRLAYALTYEPKLLTYALLYAVNYLATCMWFQVSLPNLPDLRG